MSAWLRSASAVVNLQSRCGSRDLFAWLDDKAESLSGLGASPEGPVWFTPRLRQACNVGAVTPTAVTARAEIRAERGSYSISFNSNYWPTVWRFAVAHEFGHALLEPLIRDRNLPVGSGLDPGDQAIELLCDYFAAAMLVPRRAVIRLLETDPLYRDRPSLHLISRVADHFFVQGRIAAWRILQVVGPEDWHVVRVKQIGDAGPLLRSREGNSWRTAWYVRGGVGRKTDLVSGYDVPFRTHRIIPTEMLPSDADSRTRKVRLDSRWWDGVRPQPVSESKRAMRTRIGGDSEAGFAAQVDGSLYLAFEATERQGGEGLAPHASSGPSHRLPTSGPERLYP